MCERMWVRVGVQKSEGEGRRDGSIGHRREDRLVVYHRGSEVPVDMGGPPSSPTHSLPAKMAPQRAFLAYYHPEQRECGRCGPQDTHLYSPSTAPYSREGGVKAASKMRFLSPSFPFSFLQPEPEASITYEIQQSKRTMCLTVTS